MTKQKALEGLRLGQQDGEQRDGLGGSSLNDPLLRIEGGQGVQAQPVHHLEKKGLVTNKSPMHKEGHQRVSPTSAHGNIPTLIQPLCGE